MMSVFKPKPRASGVGAAVVSLQAPQYIDPESRYAELKTAQSPSDKEQKKQIYRTSAKLSHDRLADVLDEHKEGTVKISQPVLRYTPPTSAYSNCASCQRRWTF